MNLKYFYRKEDDFKPGIYKHMVDFPDGGCLKMHLRVEEDLNGIFWLNGNESFYLNESACFFTWLLITQKSKREVKRLISNRFGPSALQAKNDFENFKPLMQSIVEGKAGADELCESGIDLVTPFSRIPGAPYRMDLALTYGCNNNCAHCYNEPGRGKNALGFEQWKQVLDVLDKIAIPHVVFTGGEPTIVPYLADLVSYADQLGIVSGLNTNGRLLRNESLTEKLKAASLDHVQVTLESVDPEIHDAMVGAKGAWEETVAGIKMAVKHHIHINTNTTMLTHNATPEAINKLSDFLSSLGVMTMGLNALIYSGKGKNVDSAIHTDQLQTLLDAAKSATERNGQRLLWYTPTQYCHFDPVTSGVGYKSCSAAKYSMCIEPDGSVLPCQSWYEPVGNILTDDWESIWNHPLCRRLRYKEYMPALCASCGTRDICTCGCPLEVEKNGAAIHPRISLPDCF
ncbi:MAG: radical SAM protein [Anaerolineaceae bacterium]|nr:radical SAM protein [Anaerolineaceae bacterium]